MNLSFLGFGNNDSDLDLCITSKKINKIPKERSLKILSSVTTKLESSIKLNNTYLRNFIDVQPIFTAFVPIIKFRSRCIPTLNIDLSVNISHNSGVEMAAYLYHCAFKCPNSNLIRNFILLIKCWAKHYRKLLFQS